MSKMRKALEPFANLANGYDNELDSDDRPVGPVTLGRCRDARAALAEPEWRPIESAPMAPPEGMERVLLYCKHDGIRVDLPIFSMTRAHPPTHWRPLPAPPEDKT